MLKSFQEEEKNYQNFKILCATKNLDVGETLNKLIRRFLRENDKEIVENG